MCAGGGEGREGGRGGRGGGEGGGRGGRGGGGERRGGRGEGESHAASIVNGCLSSNLKLTRMWDNLYHQLTASNLGAMLNFSANTRFQMYNVMYNM